MFDYLIGFISGLFFGIAVGIPITIEVIYKRQQQMKGTKK